MPKRSERAFTLIEVLGAIALLGIVYPIIITWAGQGIRSEGNSRRRLEASLIADKRLADIEIAFINGTAPQLGLTETTEDGYRLVTLIEEYEFPLAITTDPFADEAGSPRAAEATETPNLLRRIVVRVLLRQENGQADGPEDEPALAERVSFAWDTDAVSFLTGGLAGLAEDGQ